MSEVRAQLEPMAARLAAERRSESDLIQFRGAVAQLEELERGDLREQERALIDLDSQIHQLIYRATKNAYLANDLDRYYIHSLRIWNLGLGRVGHLRQAVLEHKELLEAIIQGDSDRAFNVMSKHVTEFEAEIARAF
jgi:DNA-binding GntR family transcriptional regulator